MTAVILLRHPNGDPITSDAGYLPSSGLQKVLDALWSEGLISKTVAKGTVFFD